MKSPTLLLAGAVVLLLLADVLAFHDLFQPVLVLDLTVIGSAVVAISLAVRNRPHAPVRVPVRIRPARVRRR